MDKNKTFVGQPVLSQILDTIPSSIIHAANRKHKSNSYYKRLPLRVPLVSVLYAVFSYCIGLRELYEGMLGCEGFLKWMAAPQKVLHLTNQRVPIKLHLRKIDLLY